MKIVEIGQEVSINLSARAKCKARRPRDGLTESCTGTCRHCHRGGPHPPPGLEGVPDHVMGVTLSCDGIT